MPGLGVDADDDAAAAADVSGEVEYCLDDGRAPGRRDCRIVARGVDVALHDIVWAVVAAARAYAVVLCALDAVASCRTALVAAHLH